MRKSIHYLMSMLIVAACSTPTKDAAEGPAEMSLIGQPVEYSTDSTNMKGLMVFDENDSSKKPGILVVLEWWGHNEYSQERAYQLAELGYVALAVDMYGDGKVAEHPSDAGKFMQEALSNLDEAKARFESALNLLKDHPNVDAERIGAIGYCFGGSVVINMASAGSGLDAVAAFHAGLGLQIPPDSGMIKTRILVANGADDPFIPEEQVSDFKYRMDAAGVDYKYISYPGAVHSFTSKRSDSLGVKFEMPLAYNAEADSASWAEMIALFNEAL